MALQTSTSPHSTAWRMLGFALIIAVAVLALMALATVVLGVQATGPLYDIVSDPAGLSGLAF